MKERMFELNRLQPQRSVHHEDTEKRLATIAKKIDNLVEALVRGESSNALLERYKSLKSSNQSFRQNY